MSKFGTKKSLISVILGWNFKKLFLKPEFLTHTVNLELGYAFLNVRNWVQVHFLKYVLLKKENKLKIKIKKKIEKLNHVRLSITLENLC